MNKRKTIVDMVENDEAVYRCKTCDNLSIDDLDYIIFLNVPMYKREDMYKPSVCIYCKAFSYDIEDRKK